MNWAFFDKNRAFFNRFLHFFTKKDAFLTCVFTAEGAKPAEIEKREVLGVLIFWNVGTEKFLPQIAQINTDFYEDTKKFWTQITRD